MKLSGRALSKVDRQSELYKSLAKAHVKIVAKDANTWGTAAAAEAAIRLNWVDLPTTSAALLPQLDALSKKFSSLSRIILCGMGGSSLGPEVIAQTYKNDVFIFDSTDPNYAAHALNGDLSKTLVIVSSKSGSTIETASQRALLAQRFEDAGLKPVDHFLFVTDPGSPLDVDARAQGFTVLNADPQVGGRFSVLGAFGLAPSALSGSPVKTLLDDSRIEKESFIANAQPILDTAYLLATQSAQYIGFTDAQSDMPG